MHVITPFLLAILPIVALMVLILKFKLPGHWATLITLLIVILLGLFGWHKPAQFVGMGVLEGALTGFWPICMVIIGAIYCYNVMTQNKSMETIKNMLSSVSSDPRIQVLIIAWGFGGFLEGVAGFGTAVAIPTGILIVLGFNPLKAAVLSLVANTVPVAFGAVGIPVIVLADLTKLDVHALSAYTVLQLAVFNFVAPYLLIKITDGSWKGIKGVFTMTFICTLISTLTQLLVAIKIGAELPSIIGMVVFILCMIAYCKWFKKEEQQVQPKTNGNLLLACSSYIFIVALIIAMCPMFPAINKASILAPSLFPINYGPVDAAALTEPLIHKLKIAWLNTPGVLIIIGTIIGGLLQGSSIISLFQIFFKTLYQLRKSIVTVMSIVALSKVMDTTGMIGDISQGLIYFTGSAYPFIAPFVGAIGTFVTGSDTSSNILFGKLQATAAQQIHVDTQWLTASNTSGAAMGKMISPQSIAVAVSATNLDGQESAILSGSLKYCIFMLILLGILVGTIALTYYRV